MASARVLLASFVLFAAFGVTPSFAQSPSPIYTFNSLTPNVQGWFKNFGANTIALDNNTPGQLTITETGTPGTGFAATDDFNRVRESSTAASGGLDLTGLSALEFDLGHNGTGNVNVQFFVQASTGSNFVALGPDIAVAPGVNTYRVPLSPLTAAQQVYVRTLGINTRDHTAQGNLTWTLGEVRSIGPALTQRALVTHDVGTVENGLQGAMVNFDSAAVKDNTGAGTQTGLTQNTAGTGSLQWTDLGGGPGAAISWGNGTALNGNSFNNRTTDVSNYDTVTFRVSATDPTAAGGTVNVQAFLQRNGFNFFSPGSLLLPIDGQFHDLTFSLAGITDLNLVEQTGINLGAHAQDLVMNVDGITFAVVPEPVSALTIPLLAGAGLLRRRGR
jgi:hypothetical protein